MPRLKHIIAVSLLTACPILANAFGALPVSPEVAGIPVDFLSFATTLLGVALVHGHTLQVALGGLVAIAAYKNAFTGFKTGTGVEGFVGHLARELVILTDLLGLLLGFALLSRHFEKPCSGDPAALPAWRLTERYHPADAGVGHVRLSRRHYHEH